MPRSRRMTSGARSTPSSAPTAPASTSGPRSWCWTRSIYWRSRREGRRDGRDRRRGVRARLMVGLFGGAFDPPHRGHVELARRAKDELGLDKLVVLVEADPGHKRVETPADVRLRLTQAAFPD